MLPSIAQPLASTISGAAVPLASGAAAGALARPPGAESVRTALAVVDALVGAAAKAGVLPATPKQAARAKPSGAGYAAAASAPKASSASKAKKTVAKKPGPLAFLEDPKLSLEDKLLRLLAHLNDKWEKDLAKKMKELGGAPAAKAATATKPKGKGPLGKLGNVAKLADVAKAFFPGVGVALEVLQNPIARAVLSKLGGPVLAAAASATGFPQLAPLALEYGPRLVDLAAGLATPAAGASSSTRSTLAAAAPPTTGDGEGLSSDRKAQLKLMEIQRVMDQQKEMFSMVSNLLRVGHDTRMAVVHNLR